MSNWWADKLAGKPPAQSTPPVRPPAPIPLNPQAMPTHRLPVQYDAETDQVTTKASHVRKASQCPECYSGNYFQMPGSNYMRCYDCGYPIVQSGSGMSGMPTISDGPTRAAVQVSTSNNYNPSQIIGRVE